MKNIIIIVVAVAIITAGGFYFLINDVDGPETPQRTVEESGELTFAEDTEATSNHVDENIVTQSSESNDVVNTVRPEVLDKFFFLIRHRTLYYKFLVLY